MSVLYAMPGNELFTELLVLHTGQRRQALQLHRFPDEETLVRIEPPPMHAEVAIVCTLDRPDTKLVPLLMAATTARELGAGRIGLIAPYLAYMRQDARFHPGEAISARIFGKLLAGAFDWLITADPHLHRCRTLGDVYPMDAHVVRAAPHVVEWIRSHVPSPVLIGPDSESAQWVNDVAAALDAPCLVATKERTGDRQVRVDLPGIEQWAGRTPVVLDDIISSGHTMLETLHRLRERGAQAPVCIGVHGIFAEDAREQLLAAGAAQVITSNSIGGHTALIDISATVADVLRELSTGCVDRGGATGGAVPRGAPLPAASLMPGIG